MKLRIAVTLDLNPETLNACEALAREYGYDWDGANVRTIVRRMLEGAIESRVSKCLLEARDEASS